VPAVWEPHLGGWRPANGAISLAIPSGKGGGPQTVQSGWQTATARIHDLRYPLLFAL